MLYACLLFEKKNYQDNSTEGVYIFVFSAESIVTRARTIGILTVFIDSNFIIITRNRLVWRCDEDPDDFVAEMNRIRKLQKFERFFYIRQKKKIYKNVFASAADRVESKSVFKIFFRIARRSIDATDVDRPRFSNVDCSLFLNNVRHVRVFCVILHV